MPVAFVQEFEVVSGDRSTTNYDAVAARLEGASPQGLIVHTAGFEKGEYAMPSFAGVLNDSQIESLVLYIKSLK